MESRLFPPPCIPRRSSLASRSLSPVSRVLRDRLATLNIERTPLLISTPWKMSVLRGRQFMFVPVCPQMGNAATLPLLTKTRLVPGIIRFAATQNDAAPFVLPGLSSFMTLFRAMANAIPPIIACPLHPPINFLDSSAD